MLNPSDLPNSHAKNVLHKQLQSEVEFEQQGHVKIKEQWPFLSHQMLPDYSQKRPKNTRNKFPLISSQVKLPSQAQLALQKSKKRLEGSEDVIT